MFAAQGFLIFLLIFLNRIQADDKLKFEEIYSNPLSNGQFSKKFSLQIFIGFGEDIEWVKWDEAIEKALEVNKPIFLLIHKTWCHACKCKPIFF